MLSPVGVGPSRSRVRFPVAAASRRWRRRRHDGIRSSRTLPRLGDALLRRRRRVRGGGVWLCRPLYRSLCGLRRLRRLGGDRVGGGLRQGCIGCLGRRGWLESGSCSSSCGVCRRRVSIQDRRSSGRVPGRWSFFVVFIPASASGGFCGSSQSFIAMGFLQIWGSLGVFVFNSDVRRGFGGGARRWRLLAKSGFTGSRGLFAISVSARGLCVSRVGQLSMYPSSMCLCVYSFLYVFLIQ